MKRRESSALFTKGCVLIAILGILFIVFIIDLRMAANSTSVALPQEPEVIKNVDTFHSSSSHQYLREAERVATAPLESHMKPKVAYAITVTKDGPFIDGALVLGYAAKRVHDKSKGFIWMK